jgi:hypothetical protein
MNAEAGKRRTNRRAKPNRKLTLTISTVSEANYTNAFKRDQQLSRGGDPRR